MSDVSKRGRIEVSSEYLGKRRQCAAMSRRTGERCQRWAREGMRVCATHGGATRAAKISAAKRIAQASGYAAEMLVEFMADPATPLKDRVQIAQDLLNRGNITGKTTIETTSIFDRIVLAGFGLVEDEQGNITEDPELAALLAAPDPNVIDAEIVEDERIAEKDRKLRKVRKKLGDAGALPEPYQPKAPAVDMTEDPRQRPAEPNARAQARKEFEAGLLRKIEGGKPKPKPGMIVARPARVIPGEYGDI